MWMKHSVDRDQKPADLNLHFFFFKSIGYEILKIMHTEHLYLVKYVFSKKVYKIYCSA